MEQILSILVNNGAALGLLAYFVYRDNKFMNRLNDALTEICTYIKENTGGEKKNEESF